MTTITIGDKVSFQQRTTYRPYLHTVTGVVVDLLPWTPCALALVEREDGLMDKLVPVSALSVVEMPLSEMVDDYALVLASAAGDLGGTEL